MELGQSDIGICNSALLKIGAQQISSFTDGTRASEICQALYPILRDDLMRGSPWRFALQQLVLGVPNATAPAFQYLSAYDVPDDVLKIWQVVDGGGYPIDDWNEIGNQVLCNIPTGINTIAIFQNLDPTSWDAQFAECLAWKLAANLALALVQSAPLQQAMEKGYDKAMSAARSANAVIGTPARLIADQWSGARKYGSGAYGPVVGGPPEPYGP